MALQAAGIRGHARTPTSGSGDIHRSFFCTGTTSTVDCGAVVSERLPFPSHSSIPPPASPLFGVHLDRSSVQVRTSERLRVRVCHHRFVFVGVHLTAHQYKRPSFPPPRVTSRSSTSTFLISASASSTPSLVITCTYPGTSSFGNLIQQCLARAFIQSHYLGDLLALSFQPWSRRLFTPQPVQPGHFIW